MALATKCPKCGSTFRVVADQLKLRGGLVRCGQCRTVFDAIGSLAYVDEAALTPPRDGARPDVEAALDEVEGAQPLPPATPPPSPTPPARPRPREAERPPGVERALEKKRRALGPATTLRIAPGAAPVATISEALPPPPAARGPSIAEQAQSATGVPTLMAPGAGDLPAEAALDGIEVIEIPAVAEPTRLEEAAAEPQFLREPPRARRGFSIVFGGGSLLLALVALAQIAVIFRGEVLRHWPAARPALVAACDVLRCTVGWPTQPGELAVIASELQAIAGTDVLELTTVVRNRAAFTQALPALEVTLSDTQNRALARKVFTPADYLESTAEPARRIDEGLAPGADLTIRLFIEARGLQPAGFLVYPFYI
jgi:predicted Zn finger-like uncharacterized protein